MDLEQNWLFAAKLKWLRTTVLCRLWAYFSICFFCPLLFAYLHSQGIKLTDTEVFLSVFSLCLAAISLLKIHKAFEYQKLWSYYITLGVVVLLGGMHVLHSSGYSFRVIFLLCIVIPGLLAYYFRERLVDIQAIYLAWSGYNVVLFFLLILLFNPAFLLPHFLVPCLIAQKLKNGAKFLKQSGEGIIDLNSNFNYLISMTEIGVLGCGVLSGAFAKLYNGPVASFDARFLFYAIIVCSFMEEFLFRICIKVWERFQQREFGPSGRLIS